VIWLAVFAAAGTVARPNVVLITLDTVRADHMGFLGSPRGLTPNLDAMARQSLVFTRAYAQAPLTTASHATILTGTYPQFHKVNDFDVPLARDLPYAPDIFRRHGYKTAAFVGSIILDPGARFALGFDRGFDTYDAAFHRRRAGEDRYRTIERRADEVVAHAVAWLNKHPKGPFFLWVHLYDAHDPYDPPEPYRTRYASTPYEGEIAYVDSAVSKLLNHLRARGLYEDAVIAVMADHGECLGSHGEISHGVFLYDETIRVPLVLRIPEGRSQGKRIESSVELTDVLPTILQASGIPVPHEVQGISLLPIIKSTLSGKGTSVSSAEPTAYAESDYPRRAFGWSSVRALRTGKYLFVSAPKNEVYDLSIDPEAKHDVSSTSTAVTASLARRLDTFRTKTSSSRQALSVGLDSEQKEKLSALGYVPSDVTSVTLPGNKDTGADPKDKIEVVNLLHRAELLAEDLQYTEAVPLLEQAIAKEPDMPIAYLQLGTALTILRKHEKALPVLRKAVDLRPDLGPPRYQLGSALFETGDFAGAAFQFEAAVTRFPDWAEAHFFLATCYGRTGRMPDAIREYRRVIELRPNHYGAHLLLGRSLPLAGNSEAAVPKLERAAELQPTSPEPHVFLADAYLQLDRKTDAERERLLAQRLKGTTTQ